MQNLKKMNKNNRRILAILFTGVLMGALDISIVGPAIPSIEEALSVEPRVLGWIFSIYVLFNLAGVSLFAKLSDIYGRRSIYILSLGLFAAGSLIVSLSGSFEALLVGRAVQGFGASGIFPVASAVVGDIFPREKRGRVLGLIGAVFGLAFLVGPIIAGILLNYFKWHVLFLINIPVAIVLIWASFKYIPSKRIGSGGLFDWKGILSLGLMLASFTYGINQIEPENFFPSLLSVNVLPFLVLSVILLVTTVIVEARAPNPIIKLNYFRNKQIIIVGFTAITTGLVQSTFVFLPDFTVGVYDITSSEASFMLVPLVLATAIGSPVFGRLIDMLGSKIVIMIALVLTAAGFFLLTTQPIGKMLYYTSGILVGLGLSVLSGSSLRYIMLNETAATDRAVTQGMLTIFISIGQLTGASLIGAVISNARGTAGYQDVFLGQGILLVAAFGTAFLLKNRKRERAASANSG